MKSVFFFQKHKENKLKMENIYITETFKTIRTNEYLKIL